MTTVGLEVEIEEGADGAGGAGGGGGGAEGTGTILTEPPERKSSQLVSSVPDVGGCEEPL